MHDVLSDLLFASAISFAFILALAARRQLCATGFLAHCRIDSAFFLAHVRQSAIAGSRCFLFRKAVNRRICKTKFLNLVYSKNMISVARYNALSLNLSCYFL